MPKSRKKVSKRVTWATLRPKFQAWCAKKNLGAHNASGVTILNMGYAFEAGYRAAKRAAESRVKR